MKYAKSEGLLPLALNLGIQWNGHRTARGSGRPAAPSPSPTRQPWFSGARKCEPALLASLLAYCLEKEAIRTWALQPLALGGPGCQLTEGRSRLLSCQ